jgi:DNA polymerase III alpha subunit
MPAMALLDRNGIYGSARFHTSAERNGIRAHIGALNKLFRLRRSLKKAESTRGMQVHILFSH